MSDPAAVRLLDRWMPDYDVHEVHSTRVRARPLDIHRVLFEVTADEVWLFRALMTVRGLGARMRALEAPFDPEHGAYGHGDSHDHDH